MTQICSSAPKLISSSDILLHFKPPKEGAADKSVGNTTTWSDKTIKHWSQTNSMNRMNVLQKILTGSLPSMASSHSLLLDSDSACSVITPCLEGFRGKAGLSMISLLWDPLTDRVYTGWFIYKRTTVTKIARVRMLDFKLCPHLALCFKVQSQLKAACL